MVRIFLLQNKLADSLIDGYLSLAKDINKAAPGFASETTEGSIGTLTPELELSMSDDELITLSKDWKAAWKPYQDELAKSQNDNETYWLGKQYEGDTKAKEDHPLVDNLIFESLETFLPIATRPTADPVVTADETTEGKELATKVRKMLTYWQDQASYNLKLKQVVRFWALYKLGVVKLGWSNKENDITCLSVRPQKLILDPDASIDSAEYTGEYIGEYRKESARDLIKRFPKSKDYITKQCNGKLGTKMQFIEWWTDDYLFWTMDDEVLAKSKNPHWNYDSKQDVTNEFGSVTSQSVKGKNHFTFPKKPYGFLSVFSLGLRPYDDTNLIQQNLPLQDLINKRLRQINKNADKTNGGLAVSGDSFSKEQAAGIAKATEKGGTVYVPTGDVNRAVARLSAPPLPNFVYESLIDYRNELRNIFGVRGSEAQGTVQDKTVRGKLQIKGQDSDRIGGGISTYLEQLSDFAMNYVVQMMYVYYDEEHVGTLMGPNKAAEYVKLKNSDLNIKLSVSVKDGSMIPKDPVSQREEVVNLWDMKAIDPITFFEKLDFPDPKEAAKRLFLWMSFPISLFSGDKDVSDAVTGAYQASLQAAPIKRVSESVDYAEVPDDIKRQIEERLGFKPSQMGPTADPTAQATVAKTTQQMSIDKNKAMIAEEKGVQEIQHKDATHSLNLIKQAQEIRLAKEKADIAKKNQEEAQKSKLQANKKDKNK